jgi:pantothenate kinase-related protein Tda10
MDIVQLEAFGVFSKKTAIQYCISFILKRFEVHRTAHSGQATPPPFFLGLNGVQGAGKTTLVRAGSSYIYHEVVS